MDILQQYEREHPTTVPSSPETQQFTGTSPFIAVVMRISGGRIKNTRHASYALLIIAIVFFMCTAVFAVLTLTQGPHQASPEELRRYGKIQ